MKRRLLLAGSAALLVACQGPVRRVRPLSARLQPLSEHERLVLPLQDFRFDARVGVSDGHDGGSGRLRWEQGGQFLQLRFSAGLAGRGFELRNGPEGALLVTDEGQVEQRPSMDQLLAEAWNIQLPLQALGYWLRGARQPAEDGRIALGDDGLPTQLRQHGWTVDYLRWQPAQPQRPALPAKLYAQRERQWVRLAIREWVI